MYRKGNVRKNENCFNGILRGKVVGFIFDILLYSYYIWFQFQLKINLKPQSTSHHTIITNWDIAMGHLHWPISVSLCGHHSDLGGSSNSIVILYLPLFLIYYLLPVFSCFQPRNRRILLFFVIIIYAIYFGRPVKYSCWALRLISFTFESCY